MKKLKINNIEIDLKKDALRNAEVNYLVAEAFKFYTKQGLVEGFEYNLLDVETNFFSMLFQICVDGFKYDDLDKYEELYENGVQEYLLYNVRNAEYAYNLLYKHIDKYNGIEAKVRDVINILGGEGIKEDDLESLMSTWNKVASEYNSIVGNSEESITEE